MASKSNGLFLNLAILLLFHQSSATTPSLFMIDQNSNNSTAGSVCWGNCGSPVTICAAGPFVFYDSTSLMSSSLATFVYYPINTCFSAAALNLGGTNTPFGSYQYFGNLAPVGLGAPLEAFGPYDTNTIALYSGVSFSTQGRPPVSWMTTTYYDYNIYKSFIIYNVPNGNPVGYRVSDSMSQSVCLTFFNDYYGPPSTVSRVAVYYNVTEQLGLANVVNIVVQNYPCSLSDPSTKLIPQSSPAPPTSIVTFPFYPNIN